MTMENEPPPRESWTTSLIIFAIGVVVIGCVAYYMNR